MNFPSAQCHTPSHSRENCGGLAAGAPDHASEVPIKWTGCSSQLHHWISPGLYVPICEVGLSLTSQRWFVRMTEAKPLTLQNYPRAQDREHDWVMQVIQQSWGREVCLNPAFPSLLWPLWVKGRGQGVCWERERFRGGSQRFPGLLGTWPAGFLAALTHFRAWFVSGEKPQAGVAAHPAPRAGLGSQEHLAQCLIFSSFLSASKPGLSVSSPFQVIKHRARSPWGTGKV